MDRMESLQGTDRGPVVSSDGTEYTNKGANQHLTSAQPFGPEETGELRKSSLSENLSAHEKFGTNEKNGPSKENCMDESEHEPTNVHEKTGEQSIIVETDPGELKPEDSGAAEKENDAGDEAEELSPTTAGMDLESTIPDGGWRAWLVVLGSFCGILTTFGVSNGAGTIEEHLKTNQLSDHSQSNVGWIFSLWLFFMYFGGVQTGPVFDAYGLRPLIVPGTVLWVASLFILSVCKEFYQFILGFSVLGGLASSMIFNPSVTVLGHWFRRRRSLATGIATCGGAIGGIYIPLMLNKLFTMMSYGWAIRVLAFINLGLCIVMCLTLESRNTSRKVDWREALIDVKSLAIKKFAACCAGVFLCEWSVFVPITYMVTYARAQGMTKAYSNALLAYLNVGSVIGRFVPGYIADKWGTYNVIIVTNVITGILCLALWIPGGQTKAGLTTFAVLFGIWSGSTISVTPVCVSAISDTKDYGKRYGTAYSLSSFSVLTGLPIAGALTGNNFIGMKIFAGIVYIAAGAAFLLARWLAVGKKALF